MSYEPKKVFVKTENGAYIEITYQEYKTLRETDKSFAERKFIRVYVDTLVEFDKEGYEIMVSHQCHIKYLRELDATHKLTYYGSVNTDNREEMNPVIQAERNELIKTLQNCINELTPIEQIIIKGLFFGGLNEKEVAEIVGLNQSSVNRRKKTILRKLKKKLTK